jgi:hypothetical protein
MSARERIRNRGMASGNGHAMTKEGLPKRSWGRRMTFHLPVQSLNRICTAPALHLSVCTLVVRSHWTERIGLGIGSRALIEWSKADQ